jgi:hypothetical protein
MMSQVQHGLTPAEYLRFRERYLPDHPKIIFVLESPPKSGKYFYNPEGLISEPLFSARMKDVIEIKPTTKGRGRDLQSIKIEKPVIFRTLDFVILEDVANLSA